MKQHSELRFQGGEQAWAAVLKALGELGPYKLLKRWVQLEGIQLADA